MLLSWTSLPLLITSVGLLFSMAAMGLLGVLILRKHEAQLGRSEQRLDELASRMGLIESRFDRSDRAEVTTAVAWEGLPGPTSHVSSRANSAGPLRQGSFSRNEARSSSTLIAIPDLAAETTELNAESESEMVRRHPEVWNLAAAGMTPGEIARQTEQPIGQVELIVGLYRRLNSSRGRIDHARSG